MYRILDHALKLAAPSNPFFWGRVVRVAACELPSFALLGLGLSPYPLVLTTGR